MVHRCAAKYQGFTLVETIVSILIFSMAMLGFTLLLVRVWEINGFAIESGIASQIASRGVDDVIKNVRHARSADNGSFPIESAGASEFIFYVNYDDDDDTERVRYFHDTENDVFNIGVTNPDNSVAPPTYDPVNDEVISQLANYVVNDAGGEPIFTYYDEYNNELATPATVSDITMLKILLFVNIDQVKAPNNIRIQSRTVIRNLSNFGEAPS